MDLCYRRSGWILSNRTWYIFRQISGMYVYFYYLLINMCTRYQSCKKDTYILACILFQSLNYIYTIYIYLYNIVPFNLFGLTYICISFEAISCSSNYRNISLLLIADITWVLITATLNIVFLSNHFRLSSRLLEINQRLSTRWITI